MSFLDAFSILYRVIYIGSRMWDHDIEEMFAINYKV